MLVYLKGLIILLLDPSSPNYIARRIGDRYYSGDSTERRLREYGDYPNQSRYVYINMNTDVDAGATDPVTPAIWLLWSAKICRNITALSIRRNTYGTPIH
jgi:hypothetical protein